MSVGTWGPTTGATGTGPWPFSLCIQGPDYIDAVDMASIAVSQSIGGNATLTFTIVDPTGTTPEPAGWADVTFTDNTEGEVIFGGLVMGATVRLGAGSLRYIDVRCVDYGILLDVTPVTRAVVGGALGTAAADVAAVTPLGGIAALGAASGQPGRLVSSVGTVAYTAPIEGNVPAWGTARSAMDAITGAVRSYDSSSGAYAAADAVAWITPLRQLAVHPATHTFGAAPLEVRQNPTTASHVSAEVIERDRDHRPREGGVYVRDTYTAVVDMSAFYCNPINGYTVAPGQTEGEIPDSSLVPPPPLIGESYVEQFATLYLAAKGAVDSGRATVLSAKNFAPGQLLTVYYPGAGLDGTYAITSVATRFLGGVDRLRRSTIAFVAAASSPAVERGTVSRFTRTRLARAGVTT